MRSVVGKRVCALNLTCSVRISSWESPEIADRHSGNHLRGNGILYQCSTMCEVCRGNCAIAVHVGRCSYG